MKGDYDRLNFDSISYSILTVFVCITGQWTDIMHYTAKRVGHWSVFFFLINVLVGNLMLLNLFLAIILKNVEEAKNNQNNK